MRTSIWQLLPKEAHRAQHHTCLISSLQLPSDSRRTLIWTAPGIHNHQENVIEQHRYGGAGWLVWGGSILGSRTDLLVQSITMTGHINRDVILEQHVRFFRAVMGAEFLFMDDNASSLPCKHCRRMPSKGGYQLYGLASTLTGLESNISCLRYTWPTNCSSSTPSHLSTGTSEGIA
ncbi:nibrin [Trichonephila clavipes]|nr:nibrin [Trichonephila clavipes]